MTAVENGEMAMDGGAIRRPAADMLATVRVAPWVMVAAGLAFSLAVFFRGQILARHGVVFGDRADGLIEVAILEHWRNVFHGLSPWTRTMFFYPARDTLGYNDGYLLFGLIYSLWRVVIGNPLVAADLTHAVFKAIGFVSFYLAGRIVFRCRASACVLFATIFTLANSSYVNAVHAQLLSIAFAPLLLLLGTLFLRAAPGGGRRPYVLGAATALLLDIWLLSAFYTIWFFVYATALCSVVGAVLADRRDFAATGRWLRASHRPLIATGVLTGLGIIPFWHVYHFTSRAAGMHPFAEVRQFLPSWLGIIDVGPGNLFYGDLIVGLSRLAGDDLPLAGEQVMGVPFGLLLLAGLFMAMAGARKWQEPLPVRAAAIGIALSWLLTIHVHDHTVWRFFYQHFPAGKAVRVISRYELFLSFPLTVFAMLAYVRIMSRVGAAGRLSRIGPAVLIGWFLVGEEFNMSSVLAIEPGKELLRLRRIGAPPPGCTSFYAVNSRDG